MLYKSVPFARLTLPLVAGIMLNTQGVGTTYLILYPALLILILVLCFTSRDRSGNLPYGISLMLVLILTGHQVAGLKRQYLMAPPPPPGEYLFRLDNYPVERERSIRLELSLLRILNPSVSQSHTIMVYVLPPMKTEGYRPGDLVSLRIKPDTIVDFNPDDDFDYARFMLLKGYRYYSFSYDCAPTGERRQSLRTLSRIVQERLMRRYASGIANRLSLSLVSALTLGYRSLVEEEVSETFRRAGISHIMAVSGLHVGIVSLLAAGLLGLLFPRWRRWHPLPVILIIWLFAMVSGMTPSVTRASLMFSFLNIGRMAGRHVHPINSLFASAFFILLFNPLIIYTPGFQLSYSAVAAILLFYRPMVRLVEFSGAIMHYAWSMVVVTLLAQAGTLPFLLYHFGTVSPYSLLTNFFAIPLATLIIMTGFTFLLLPQPGVAAEIIGWILTAETQLLYSISDWIAPS